MSRIIAALLTLTVACGTLFAQTADNRPRFPAADIRIHTGGQPRVPLNVRTIPALTDRYRLTGPTMLEMIALAWEVSPDAIVGGPAWLDMDRFDITTLIPADTQPQDVKRMLQTLLEDRFHLAVHKDNKPIPGYVLIAPRRPSLKAAVGSEPSGCLPYDAGKKPEGGMALIGDVNGVSVHYTVGPGALLVYNCRNMTMDQFVRQMPGMVGLGGVHLDTNPAVNQTGLQGAWNFDLSWTMDYYFTGPNSVARLTLSDALDKQLGLKLEERPVTAPALVVDRVNRTPTPNPPNLNTLMPSLPLVTQFEVASVKQSGPDSRHQYLRILPGGRVTIEGLTMLDFLQLAFPYMSSPPIQKMPEWAPTSAYDITAQPPAGTALLTRETVGPPILALLKERFGFVYHTGDQPGPAYLIEAPKPKMKQADPASRTSCRRDSSPSDSLGGPVRIICRNITMAQFADWFKFQAIGMRSGPFIDNTHLSGGWNFTLTYDPQPARPASDQADAATDPAGGVTLFEAVEKQLGLKLTTTTRPQPMIIIDHLNEKPTAN